MRNGCRLWPTRSPQVPGGADACRRHVVSSGLIYTCRRKLIDSGVAQEASAPEALPTPVFVEAVMDDDPAVTASTLQ